MCHSIVITNRKVYIGQNHYRANKKVNTMTNEPLCLEMNIGDDGVYRTTGKTVPAYHPTPNEPTRPQYVNVYSIRSLPNPHAYRVPPVTSFVPIKKPKRKPKSFREHMLTEGLAEIAEARAESNELFDEMSEGAARPSIERMRERSNERYDTQVARIKELYGEAA